jgi:hypothetical protein
VIIGSRGRRIAGVGIFSSYGDARIIISGLSDDDAVVVPYAWRVAD